MANRYNFSSIGAGATDQLLRVLAENEARKQQELINSLKQREMALAEQQEKRQADYQRQLFADQALHREAQRVDREYDDSVEGDILDAATADRWARHGRGGAFNRGGETGQVGEARMNPDSVNFRLQGDVTPEEMAIVDEALTGSIDDLNITDTKRSIAPGVIMSKGGTKWRADRQAALERQAREKEAREQRAYEREREERFRRETQDRELAYRRERDEDNARLRRDLKTVPDTSWRDNNAVNSLDARFGREPIVKNFNEVALKEETVRQILSGNGTGPSDLASVFEFMRALDPTSVVRESEYATAAKSGNIFLGTMAKFNGMINEQGGFLSPQVRDEFKRLIDVKLRAQRKQYNNLAKEYGEKIDRITKQPGTGQNYLTDYAGAFDPAPEPTSPTTGSKIKSIKRIN